MSRGFLLKMVWLSCLIACLFLTGCAGKKANQVKVEVAFEPEAIKEPALSPEEVACLKSTGEIDRNLPSTAMADVTKQYRYYLRQGRAHMQASVRRSEKYLPYAREVFHKRGMPKDLAYLAIVESGYRTDAKSHAGAVGAWQFIPGTGKNFGLHQDGWTDERMDFYEATEAAADYLRKLHTKFQDWPTAIAAYNAGEGKMKRALDASGSRNFFEVRERNETLPYDLQLREETKQYVPRFLAVTKIMRNLKALNFMTTGEPGVSVARLKAQPGTDLKSFSKSLNIPWGDFCKLNTHHRGEITSVSQSTYVYVPKDKAEAGSALLAERPKGEYANWQVCTINSSGKSWKQLGNYYHIPSEKLRALNPGCSLKTGELVFLPSQKGVGTSSGSLRAERRSYGKTRTHVLQRQETLYSVAKRYGVSPTELMHYNHISSPAHLPTGKVLQIPSHQEKHYAKVEPHEGTHYGSLGKRPSKVYVVQAHDTLWSIAKRNHTSVDELKRWNNVDERTLQTGAKLTVYAD